MASTAKKGTKESAIQSNCFAWLCSAKKKKKSPQTQSRKIPLFLGKKKRAFSFFKKVICNYLSHNFIAFLMLLHLSAFM